MQRWPSWERVEAAIAARNLGQPPPGARAVVDFEDFLGNWKDSKGNTIKVSLPDADESQDVLKIAMAPEGKRREIVVLLAKIPEVLGGFKWGRYRLDFQLSHTERLIWIEQATDPNWDMSGEDRIWARVVDLREPFGVRAIWT